MADRDEISLAEAATRAGVSPATLKRWAAQKVIPIKDGHWTPAAAAQARIVARMRERGYSLDALKKAGKEGRLAFGYVEDLFPPEERNISLEQAAEETGLEPALIERIMAIFGTPSGRDEALSQHDLEALKGMAEALAAGFPLVAFLQIARVYAHSIRHMTDSEARLFHLYVHEPLMRDGVPGLEMAEEMEEMAEDLMPLALPLIQYLRQRYLRYFVTQDVIGHMEQEFGDSPDELDRVMMAISFVDLANFVRYTEEEGDEEAVDFVERFTETVEETLPPEASVVKMIGDEVMVVSPDPASLTDWAVGLQTMFEIRPQPRIGIHYGGVVYRDGDYFGREVNMAARVVARAQGGEVMVTTPVAETLEDFKHLDLRPIGEVRLKGFPEPIELFVVTRVAKR